MSNKHGGYLTPKAIANRMKAKGLQKLRWYCQMCKKQCRDANGFKCHKTSEGHQRMMRIFRENRSTILDNYSREFEKCFMDLVRRRWRTKRVFANKVYNEYISDRHHVHMNATIWESLSSFVKYLGRTKQCEVDQTEKGWYVKYIDRDPDILAQQEAIKKKEKMDMDDDMRNRERIQKMIAAHQEIAENAEKESEIENEEEKDDLPEDIENKEIINSELEKVQFKLAPTIVTPIATTTVTIPTPVKKISFLEETPIKEEIEPEKDNAEKKRRYSGSSEQDQRKKQRKNDTPKVPQQLTALEELTSTIKKKQSIREEQDLKKKLEKLQQEKDDQPIITPSSNEVNDNWIIPGLVVKIMNKKVGDGSYYGKKAKIVDVVDLYIAIIQILDSNIKLKIDQAHLETVIPAIGSDIAIVNGEHRGKVGILEEVNVDTYKAIIRVDDTIVHKDYEDVCKLISEM
jgi:DNA/RNA-binding protein KIN17